MLPQTYNLSIDGRMVAADATFDVINPATATVVAQAPDASSAQLDAAVDAAAAAFVSWSTVPIEERKVLVSKLGDVIEANLDPLVRLLTTEQGKPHADAAWEIGGAAAWCRATATLELPTTVNEDTAERYSVTRHVPIGVVGAIAPWNFPVILAIWKVAPALVAGNTVVLKPSPFTPLTTLRIGELAQAVLPPGVLNVLSGGDALGPQMSAHPRIDKISFTGSTATGRKVMASAAANLKRLTLELGGNDAAIVLPDVDLDEAVPNLFWAAFRNTGQVCVAAKRMYVHEAIYDEFAQRMAAYAETVKMGDGSEQGAQLGPIQNKLQFERVRDLIRSAREEGLNFLTGGEPVKGDGGYFIPVTIVDNPPDTARVVREEAFGPVLPMLRFSDLDDVVRRANDSDYGLAGSVWSGDPEKARAIGERLQCGTVWINEVQHLTPFAAFAGHGQSGVGVENGVEGLLEYTNTQTISMRRAPFLGS